jgi:hypothetical protein
MFRTSQPKFTKLIVGLALTSALAVATSGCGGGGGGGNGGGGGGNGTFTISGTAEYTGGAPIQNSEIDFRPDGGQVINNLGTTRSDGTFSITGLTAGESGIFRFDPAGTFQEYSAEPTVVPQNGTFTSPIVCSSSPPGIPF